MTIRQLVQIAVSNGNLNADVKINYSDDITSIHFDNKGNLMIGANGYNQGKLRVRTEIEVKSPYSGKSQIF